MDRQSVKIFKDRLLELRTRLRGDVSQMGYVPDCEMSLQLLAGKEQLLQQIEHALELIEDGIYGECERCGRSIPKARLTAVPYAAVCAGCAATLPNGQDDASPSRGDAASQHEDGWDASQATRPMNRPSTVERRVPPQSPNRQSQAIR